MIITATTTSAVWGRLESSFFISTVAADSLSISYRVLLFVFLAPLLFVYTPAPPTPPQRRPGFFLLLASSLFAPPAFVLSRQGHGSAAASARVCSSPTGSRKQSSSDTAAAAAGAGGGGNGSGPPAAAVTAEWQQQHQQEQHQRQQQQRRHCQQQRWRGGSSGGPARGQQSQQQSQKQLSKERDTGYKDVEGNTMAPLEVVENIEKPTTDKRKYRHLRLSNGLQVLLVSDEEAEMSAAALDVNVGSFFDPVEAQGLAHFCEHMLFLGSASFPLENEYANHIKQHGGMHNAYTEQTHTTFFFSVAAANLAGALERFAAFFVCPLFTAGAAAREAHAVDSEFRLRRANDAVRRWHLIHHLSNPRHPFSQFSCGNIASLTAAADLETGLRQQLLQFYNKWYSANIMALAVLGRESLDELQRLVQLLFERVENKRLPTMPSLTLLTTAREAEARGALAAREGRAEHEAEEGTARVDEQERAKDGLGEGTRREEDGRRRGTEEGAGKDRKDEKEEKERKRGSEGEAAKRTESATAAERAERKSQDEKEEQRGKAAAGEGSAGVRVMSSAAGEVEGILPVFRPGIDLEKLVYVTPVKDFKEVHFQFVLPPMLHKWRSKPARFLGHLVGHEGRGSLLAALKKHALASGLNAWCLEEECVSIFHISIELTELGISDAGLDRVSELVLRYLQLLRAQPPAAWLYKEKQELAKLHFLFADKEDALSFCATHAKRLHLYPPQQIISGSHLFFTYDAAEVRDVLQQLTLEQLRVEIVGKRFEEKCNQTEPIYGVVYGVYDIPHQQRKLWTEILSAGPEEAVAAAAAEGLHYPAPNPFIPTDLSLRSSRPAARTAAAEVSSPSAVAAATDRDSTLAAAGEISAARTPTGSPGVEEEEETKKAEAATTGAAEPAARAASAVRAAPATGEEVLANGVVAAGAAPGAETAGTTSRSSAADTAAPAGAAHSVEFSGAATAAAEAARAAGRGAADGLRSPPAMVAASPGAAGLPVELPVSDVPALAGKTRFFFKQDDTFFLPKLSMRLWVSTAYSARGVREWLLSWVYVDTVALMLNEELYDADIAGLFYSLSSGDWPGEVSIALHGFSHKLPLMLHKLTYALAHRGHTQEDTEGEREHGGSAKGARKGQAEVEKCGATTKAAETAGEAKEREAGEEKDGRKDGVSRKGKEERVKNTGVREERDEREEGGQLKRDSRRREEEKGKPQGDEEQCRKETQGGKMDSEKRENGGETNRPGTSNMGLDRNMYELVKEGLLRRLKNRLTYRTVYQQAMTLCGEALEDPFYSYEEQIAALKTIQFEEVEAVAEQLFYRAHVEGLAVGNMLEQECLHMLCTAVQNLNIQETGTNLSPKAVLDLSAVDLCALSLADKAKTEAAQKERQTSEVAEGSKVGSAAGGRKPAGGQNEEEGRGEETKEEGEGGGSKEEKTLSEVAARRGEKETEKPGADEGASLICKGETVCVRVQQKNPNPEDYNNAAFLRLQLGELELRERAMLALLSHWLEQPFFDEMRTQQQLGYVTQASKNVQLRTHTLDFFIASKYPPSLLASRMETFLQTRLSSRLERLREELSEDLFELHKRALISELSVKPQNIYEETQRYVVEIYFKTFLFDRYAQTIKQLESLTRDECLSFICHTLMRAPALMLWIHAQQQPQQEGRQQRNDEAAETRRLLAAGRSDGATERVDADKGPQLLEKDGIVSQDNAAAAPGDAAHETAARRAEAAVAEGVKEDGAAELAKQRRGGGKGAAEIAAHEGGSATDEKRAGVAKEKRSEVKQEGEERQNTGNFLGKEWTDVCHPRRLRDFASRRFVMPA